MYVRTDYIFLFILLSLTETECQNLYPKFTYFWLKHSDYF